MSKKLLGWFVFFGLVVTVSWLIWHQVQNQVRIVFCDVGQGDGVLIRYRDIQLVVDGGPANGQMVSCLSQNLPLWDRRIELAILTHPDADHLGGLVEVLENYEVEKVLTNGERASSDLAQRFFELAGERVVWAKRGDLVQVDSLSLELVWPPLEQVLGGESEEEGRNERSLVAHLRYGEFDALLTGDAGIEVEPEFWVGEVEVLKVSHHGSKTGTSQELVWATSPELAVVSVGKNWFGHPDPEVLERLSQAGSRVLRTDLAGGVELVVTQDDWRLVGERGRFGI